MLDSVQADEDRFAVSTKYNRDRILRDDRPAISEDIDTEVASNRKHTARTDDL